jgi:hypothetical protein
MFVITDAAFVSELVRTIGAPTLANRGLEIVTPRLWGRTMYVFARGGDLDPNARLQGWVRWAGSEDPDVRLRARAVLRRLGFANVEFTSMDFAPRMAQGLVGSANGGVDIVCIYDEEPSSFLVRFLEGVRAGGQTVRLLWKEQDPAGAAFAVSEGIASLTVPYETQRFYHLPSNVTPPTTEGGRVPAVVLTPPITPAPPMANAPPPFRMPLVFTNARATGDLAAVEKLLDRRLSQFVNHAYLRALFETGMSRCDPRDAVSADHFKTVLLSAFLSDRDDPYTVLGLLEHLDVSRNLPRPERNNPYSPVSVFEQILRDDYKLTSTTAESLAAWLRTHAVNSQPITKTDLRARFANYPDDRIYSTAIESLRAAVADPRIQQRRQLLEQTRETLVALAEVKRSSGCGTPDIQRGLWTGGEFEPYFYLAVIDATLRDVGTAK